MRRNAGKVMRLKIPNTTTKARMAVGKGADRCSIVRNVYGVFAKLSHLAIHNPLNKNQTPRDS